MEMRDFEKRGTNIENRKSTLIKQIQDSKSIFLNTLCNKESNSVVEKKFKETSFIMSSNKFPREKKQTN